jgi:hypothetical protein
MTLAPAARVLGIDVGKLRRWVNEGRFDHIDGLDWVKNGFQDQRVCSRKWIERVAAEIEVTPDFSKAPTGG